MRVIYSTIIFLFIHFSALTFACTDDNGKNVVGIYSDLHMNEESGDLIGIELFIVSTESNYYLIFQSAEGVPSVPEIVLLNVNGDKLSFSLSRKEFGYSGKFEGLLKENRIIGSFLNGQLSPSGEKLISLPKGKSYWQQDKKICPSS